MKLRRLTDTGIARFGEYLDLLETEPERISPTELLTDAVTSQSVQGSVELEDRVFQTRYELAEYLYQKLSKAGLDDVRSDAGLWSWLALFWLESICPKVSGKRKLRERARYIPDPSFRRYYRHLIAGPYMIYRAHAESPKSALVVLCQPPFKPGDVVEQIASRQELVTNRALLEVATSLYVDPKTQRPKRGSQTQGAGAARRLVDVMYQFDVTWDLYAMPPKEISDLLPNEFNRFS